MKFQNSNLAIPLWFVWAVIGITLLPDLLNLTGVNFGNIDFVLKSFIHNALELFCVTTAFLIVFLSVIDFKIKGDVSTPIVGITMLCSGLLDMVHVLASNNLIFQEYSLTFISVYTWSLSRTFNALLLLIGVGLFLNKRDSLFKNIRKHNLKFLVYTGSALVLITIAYLFFVFKLGNETGKLLTLFVFERKLDIIPLVLYLFSLTIIFPKFYQKHPSAFSQTLLLSLLPSISAQLHLISGMTLPFDNNAMIAYYEKLFSYLIPFAGIGMNYMQTHHNEVRAQYELRTESQHKNMLNNQLEGILNASLNGIMVFENVRDENNNIVDFKCIRHNQSVLELINANVEQQYFTDIFPGDPTHFTKYLKMQMTGENLDTERYNEETKKWFKISVVPFNDGFVKSVTNITELKNAELSLELKVRELDRSNSELEHFAYMASHDLQEPLRKISSFGDRLKARHAEELSGNGVDYVNRMIDATSRMQRLINDLLSFSRLSRAKDMFYKVDLNKVMSDILSDIEISVISGNASIESEELPVIEALPAQMQQLFQNLILNSIKFRKMRERVRIHISAEKIVGKAYGYIDNNVYYKITVVDNGIGFEQKHADKIFTLFHRLNGRSEYDGTGIGLALCRKIVEYHKGKIFASGVEGQGASFSIILPQTQSGVGQEPPAELMKMISVNLA